MSVKEHVRNAIAELLSILKDKEFKHTQLGLEIEADRKKLDALYGIFDEGASKTPTTSPTIVSPSVVRKRSYQGTDRVTAIGKQVRELMNDGETRSLQQIKKDLRLRGPLSVRKLSAAISYMHREKYLVRIGKGIYRKNSEASSEMPVAEVVVDKKPPRRFKVLDCIPLAQVLSTNEIAGLLPQEVVDLYNAKTFTELVRELAPELFRLAESGHLKKHAAGLFSKINGSSLAEVPQKIVKSGDNTVRKIVADAVGRGDELNARQVFERVGTKLKEKYPGHTEGHIKSKIGAHLANLAQSGQLVRVREGVYTFK